jgi:hypothetical protein
MVLGKDTDERLKTETERLPQAGPEIERNLLALGISRPHVLEGVPVVNCALPFTFTFR